MSDVLILAWALSMDAFAVSLGLGAKQPEHRFKLALKAALYFGLFQGMMPLIGYLGGVGSMGWIEGYTRWIAFALLVLIGGKMILESRSEGVEADSSPITHRVMVLLAVATSIDAMAAGFSLTLFNFDPFLACLLIAGVTFGFSYVGVLIGAQSGTWLESKAEFLGGLVLVLMGFKLLWV